MRTLRIRTTTASCERIAVHTELAYRFDPADLEQLRLLGQLHPGRRVRVMPDARELAVGLTSSIVVRGHEGVGSV